MIMQELTRLSVCTKMLVLTHKVLKSWQLDNMMIFNNKLLTIGCLDRARMLTKEIMELQTHSRFRPIELLQTILLSASWILVIQTIKC